MPNKYLTPQA